MDVQAVVRGGQLFPARDAVLGEVDVRLRVLYPSPHGKGLGLEREPGVEQHFEGVPRAVARGEYQALRADVLGDAAGGDGDAAERAVPDVEPVEAGAEADLAAEGLDLAADTDDDPGEHVGAEVGLGVVGDGGLGTVVDEPGEDPGYAAVVRAGAEFAVGEGPGAALAELHVGLGVEQPAGAEGLNGLLPLVHARPALEDDGAQSRAGEDERSEDARGPKARDEGPRPRGREPRYLVPGLGLRGFAAEADADGVDPAYRPTPACVKTPAEDDELLYVPRTDAEPLRREGVEPLLAVSGF